MKHFSLYTCSSLPVNPLNFSYYPRKLTATEYAPGRTPGAVKRACHKMAKDMKKHACMHVLCLHVFRVAKKILATMRGLAGIFWLALV